MKERLETDPRYKAVESSALREELFKQYMEKQAKVGAGFCVEDDVALISGQCRTEHYFFFGTC